MNPASERSPGQYARERYRRAMHAYRRRMRRPVLIACLPGIIVATGLAVWFDTAPWWYFAGGVTGGLFTVAMFTFGDPPGHIAKWGMGAEGERRTAKALRPLLRKGWTVVHDVQRPHENFDHVLVGPPGVFLLETKVRTGTTRLEDGMLTIRYPDDPDEVVTLPRLGAQMRARAASARTEYAFNAGTDRWVTPVVVLWGDFPQGRIEHDGVTYVHGDQLVGWLRSFPWANAARREPVRVS